MALFKWFSQIEGSCISSALQASVEELGLAIDPSLCHRGQLFASDPINALTRHHTRVTVLATWSDKSSHEVQIEVRSDEPLLRSGTRCETLATALKQALDRATAIPTAATSLPLV